MNELNKKLLEFAGFKLKVRLDEELNMSVPVWIYPDGGWDRFEDAPNLTESLDACFKWLVPKLIEMGCYIQLNSAGFWFAEIWERAVVGRNTRHVGEGETPALALCRAVEKIIDGEKKC